MDTSSQIFELLRIYLAVFFTFVAVFYTSRIFLLKRRTGEEFVHPGARFSGTWWNHMVFRLFRVLIWGVCVARLVDPRVDHSLGLIRPLQMDGIMLAGAVLLTAGFGLALVSHFALGRFWHSGFVQDVPAGICTSGPYRFSRNPAFLGVMIAQVGFWLALPSLFSTLCLIVGLVTVYRQTLSEEQHMQMRFGALYTDYSREVPRWV